MNSRTRKFQGYKIEMNVLRSYSKQNDVLQANVHEFERIRTFLAHIIEHTSFEFDL